MAWSPSDYAAWWGAGVATALAGWEWWKSRNESQAVLACYAELTGTAAKPFLKIHITNEGGRPTTLIYRSLRVGFRPRWAWAPVQAMLRLMPLDDRSIFAEPPSIARDVDLMPDGSEVTIPVQLSADRIESFKQGRIVLKLQHTAIQRRWCYVPVNPHLSPVDYP